MSPWGWKPERTLGIWRHGALWTRPFVAAAPYLTVLTLLALFHFIGGKLTSGKGILFDLPEGSVTDGEATEMVALVMPMPHETLVFFDDSRYVLGDDVSARAFGENISERVRRSVSKTLMVLADRRVPGGELMKLAELARASGAARILFAEKTSEAVE